LARGGPQHNSAVHFLYICLIPFHTCYCTPTPHLGREQGAQRFLVLLFLPFILGILPLTLGDQVVHVQAHLLRTASATSQALSALVWGSFVCPSPAHSLGHSKVPAAFVHHFKVCHAHTLHDLQALAALLLQLCNGPHTYALTTMCPMHILGLQGNECRATMSSGFPRHPNAMMIQHSVLGLSLEV